jgi:hypothetical protein
VTGAGCCAVDAEDEPVEDEPVEAPVEVEPVDEAPVDGADVAGLLLVELAFFRWAIDRRARLVAVEPGAVTAAWLFLPSAGS